jgi:6-pyruvoyltetrahydropterin/6-carboxytetrahydropterin synthase
MAKVVTTSITKIITFDAGHRLSDYVGKCQNIHGHTYRVEVTIKGIVDNSGMILDFGKLKEVLKEVVENKFDHKLILKSGDVVNRQIEKVELPETICWVEYNPTAENMAKDIFDSFRERFASYELFPKWLSVERVRVYETQDSYAEVSLEEEA